MELRFEFDVPMFEATQTRRECVFCIVDISYMNALYTAYIQIPSPSASESLLETRNIAGSSSFGCFGPRRGSRCGLQNRRPRNDIRTAVCAARCEEISRCSGGIVWDWRHFRICSFGEFHLLPKIPRQNTLTARALAHSEIRTRFRFSFVFTCAQIAPKNSANNAHASTNPPPRRVPHTRRPSIEAAHTHDDATTTALYQRAVAVYLPATQQHLAGVHRRAPLLCTLNIYICDVTLAHTRNSHTRISIAFVHTNARVPRVLPLL